MHIPSKLIVAATKLGGDPNPGGLPGSRALESLVGGVGSGWLYNENNGHLFVNSSATDSKGISYSTYGY